MAKLMMLEFHNSWTDCHEIWHGWLRRMLSAHYGRLV